MHNPSPSPVADAVDNQVSEAQLVEAEFAGGISSGRVLYRQEDKEGRGGRAFVLHRDSLSKQLKKVGGVLSLVLLFLRWVCHCSFACWQVMDLV